MEYRYENEILELMRDAKKRSADSIASVLGVQLSLLSRALESLEKKGLLKREREVSAKYILIKKQYVADLPEHTIYKKAPTSLDRLDDEERSVGLGFAIKKGFVRLEGGRVIKKMNEEDFEEDLSKTKKLLEKIEREGVVTEDVSEFLKRGIIKKKESTTTHFSITEKGMSTKPTEKIFDVKTETKYAEVGKAHLLTKTINRIRTVFLEMGFEEMKGNVIEDAFWNFDALFQPQDHPARELADTFYLDMMGELPKGDLVKRVKAVHEKAWKYKWMEHEAKKKILRTHTTAVSARYLASLKDRQPKKYFIVGKVFRNEATDSTHLAEFHQVEGIIIDERTNFRDLLGVLKEFYLRIGFEKIMFRPSYFPYTEPSVEVLAYFKVKRQWLEIGGAGIFRPEVSIPLCNRFPVLAWGLSLERPLMIVSGEGDVRVFYKNELIWLEKCTKRWI